MHEADAAHIASHTQFPANYLVYVPAVARDWDEICVATTLVPTDDSDQHFA